MRIIILSFLFTVILAFACSHPEEKNLREGNNEHGIEYFNVTQSLDTSRTRVFENFRRKPGSINRPPFLNEILDSLRLDSIRIGYKATKHPHKHLSVTILPDSVKLATTDSFSSQPRTLSFTQSLLLLQAVCEVLYSPILTDDFSANFKSHQTETTLIIYETNKKAKALKFHYTPAVDKLDALLYVLLMPDRQDEIFPLCYTYQF